MTQLKGVDVSHHNGTVNWAQKKAEGNLFCSIKATEGLTNVDPMYAKNVAGSHAVGIPSSGYHFFHPALDAKAQAAHFISVIGRNQSGHLPPLFDFETLDGLGGKVTSEHARICCQEIENAIGHSPELYGSPGFIEGLGDMSWAAHLNLWIAHYRVSHPRIPKPWVNYTFWQTNDANGWDLDLFNGSAGQLAALII